MNYWVTKAWFSLATQAQAQAQERNIHQQDLIIVKTTFLCIWMTENMNLFVLLIDWKLE